MHTMGFRSLVIATTELRERNKTGTLDRQSTRTTGTRIAVRINPSASKLAIYNPWQEALAVQDRNRYVRIVHDDYVLHLHPFEKLIGDLKWQVSAHGQSIEKA